MANLSVLWSRIVGGGGDSVTPKINLKLIDNGDGSYSLATSSVGGSMLPVMEVPTGAINGINTVFTTSQVPSPAKTAVFNDGVLDLGFVLVGDTLTMTIPPVNSIFVIYFPS